MKIDERVSNYIMLLNSETDKGAAPSGDVAGSHAIAETAPVEVNLSPSAVQLAEDEAHREHLDAIRRRLAEGSYNISGKDVADKILNVLKG